MWLPPLLRSLHSGCRRSLSGRFSTARQSRGFSFFRPELEQLEQRTLLSSGILADSISDFSSTQGQDNWFYGYYTVPGFRPSFIQMPYFTSRNGGAWAESTTQPPWTLLWQEGGHPNGS